MQNNRCIGLIHAVAEWSIQRCALYSYGVGSKPIRGIFGNIFIDFFFFLLYKQKQPMQCM